MLLSSMWLVATYGPPEQRFFATIHITMWVIALSAVWSRITRMVTTRLRRLQIQQRVGEVQVAHRAP